MTAKTLTQALADAQAELKNAAMDGVNPHFKSKYATLASVRDAVMPTFAKHGIAVTQTMVATEGMPLLRTTIYKGEEAIHSDFPLAIDFGNAQKVGSYLTYARRYSLAAIACISADEDDDGNAATPQKGSATVSTRTAPPPQMSQKQADETVKRLISQIETCQTSDELDFEIKQVSFRRDLNDLSRSYPDLAESVVAHGKAVRNNLVQKGNMENFPV